MFRLGRRKNKFTERYNRIGAGQRIGSQPNDEDQSVSDMNTDPPATEADTGHDRGAAAEIIDPVLLYQSDDTQADAFDTNPTDHGETATIVDGQAGLPEISGSGLPDVNEMLPVEQSVSPIANPGAPGQHANEHDHVDGQIGDDAPSWLDSFDPDKPAIRPPELPQSHATQPSTAGEVSSDPGEEHEAGATDDDVAPVAKQNKQGKTDEPAQKEAEPAPSWLDTAEKVESRPPPMEFEGVPELPVAEDAVSSEIERQEPSLADVGSSESGVEEAGQSAPGLPDIEPLTTDVGDAADAETPVSPVADAHSGASVECSIAGQTAPQGPGGTDGPSPAPSPATIGVDTVPETEIPDAPLAAVPVDENEGKPIPVKVVAPPIPMPPPL